MTQAYDLEDVEVRKARRRAQLIDGGMTPAAAEETLRATYPEANYPDPLAAPASVDPTSVQARIARYKAESEARLAPIEARARVARSLDSQPTWNPSAPMVDRKPYGMALEQPRWTAVNTRPKPVAPAEPSPMVQARQATERQQLSEVAATPPATEPRTVRGRLEADLPTIQAKIGTGDYAGGLNMAYNVGQHIRNPLFQKQFSRFVQGATSTIQSGDTEGQRAVLDSFLPVLRVYATDEAIPRNPEDIQAAKDKIAAAKEATAAQEKQKADQVKALDAQLQLATHSRDLVRKRVEEMDAAAQKAWDESQQKAIQAVSYEVGPENETAEGKAKRLRDLSYLREEAKRLATARDQYHAWAVDARNELKQYDDQMREHMKAKVTLLAPDAAAAGSQPVTDEGQLADVPGRMAAARDMSQLAAATQPVANHLGGGAPTSLDVPQPLPARLEQMTIGQVYQTPKGPVRMTGRDPDGQPRVEPVQ